ncbi:MAG: sulfite exporter TauE/SafE family protein [Alphaproteobacteria bacterium]|nr:sulfite exporter TauE/SafE family protein [Alphaproteobacteria bacterium]
MLGLESLEPVQLAMIGGVAVLASLVGAMSGFGAGLIIIAFLAPIVGSRAVVPIVSAAMILGLSSRVIVYRRELPMWAAWRVLLPALPGAVVGATIFAALPPEAVDWLLGIVLCSGVVLRRVLHARGIVLTPRGLTIFGIFYGVLTGTMPGMGPVLITALLWAGVRGGGLVGADAVISTALATVKTATFAWHGLMNTELFMAAMLLGLCMLPGAWVARFIVNRLGIRLHTILMEIVLIACGLWFFIRAIRSIL